MELVEEIVAMQEELALWRKDIHAHPELGFEENRTADFVAQKLEEFGIQVNRGIGETGLVGVLQVCRKQPTRIPRDLNQSTPHRAGQ